MSLSYLNPLSPFCVYKPWGGKRLAKLKGISPKAGQLLGETWEVSRLAEGESLDINGNSLAQLTADQLPYLIKFLDTLEPLSVQVHPDDEYAAKYENSSGKTECWVILQADEGAGLYLGFKPETKPSDFFKDACSGADVSKYLQFHKVKAGDFFYVPAGSVHALGAGVTLAEIQQSSGVTYRVWDWNRVDSEGKSRQLHIDQSKAVLNFSKEANTLSYFKHKNIFNSAQGLVIEHPQFKVSYYSGDKKFDSIGKDNRVVSIINLDGILELKTTNSNCQLKPYQCSLLESGVKIEACGNSYLVVE